MTAGLEQNMTSCLKQSALQMQILALILNLFPCPLSGCANTHDPLSEAHKLTHPLCVKHVHTDTHTHAVSAVLYNQQF